MSEQKETNGAVETEIGMTQQQERKQAQRDVPTHFFGGGFRGLAGSTGFSVRRPRESRHRKSRPGSFLELIRARKTNLFLMKIRVPIFPRRPITATSSQYGIPSI